MTFQFSPKYRPTVLDVFCGAGGLSEGFKQAGFKIIGGIDCDEYALKTFLRNHSKSIGILASIENITAKEIIERLQGNWPDVIVGSPPCQGFTTIAQPKLRSLDSLGTFNSFRNMLYKKFVDIVQVLRPKFFVMENVKGMLTYCNGLIPYDISQRMSQRYRIDIQYKDAADYGVPQHRKRVFIIGNGLGVQNPDAPPSHFSSESKPPTARFMTREFVSVQDAISDLPRLGSGRGKNIMKYRAKPRSKYQTARRRRSKMVFNHIARRHCEAHLEMFRKLGDGEWLTCVDNGMHPYRIDIFKDRIKRQPWHFPSSTVMAHIHKDGLMFIHPKQDRTLTPREAARLQSFDDRYFFVGPVTEIYRQIGNAVPPLMARAIAREIFKLLRCAEIPVLYNSRRSY